MEEDIAYLTDHIDIDLDLDPGGSILPSQFFAPVATWTPEQRLYAELLADAMRALEWAAGRRETHRRWAETIAWLDGTQTSVTFRECCAALDLDPEAGRRAIYQRITEYRRANLAKRRPLPRRRPARPAPKSPARKAITRKVESAQQRLLLDLPVPAPRPARVRRPRPATPPVQASHQLSFDWFVREPGGGRLAA